MKGPVIHDHEARAISVNVNGAGGELAGEGAQRRDLLQGHGAHSACDFRGGIFIARANADVDQHRLIDAATDATEHEAVRLAHDGHVSHHGSSDSMGRHVVELAHVGHRVFAGGRFHRHGPARRNQAAYAISTTDLSVITRLG